MCVEWLVSGPGMAFLAMLSPPRGCWRGRHPSCPWSIDGYGLPEISAETPRTDRAGTGNPL